MKKLNLLEIIGIFASAIVVSIIGLALFVYKIPKIIQ